MDLKTFFVIVCLFAAIWVGARPMLKRKHVRETVLYAAMLGWAAYSVLASLHQWPQLTIVNLVQLALDPVGALLIRIIGAPLG